MFAIKNCLKNVPWKYVMEDIKDEEIFEVFYEKYLQKTNQIEFRIEKVIKIICMSNWKVMIIQLLAG